MISTFLEAALVDGSPINLNQLTNISNSFFLLNTQTPFQIEPDNPFDLAYSNAYNSWIGVCKKNDKISFIVLNSRAVNNQVLLQYQQNLRNDILFYGLNASKFLYEGFYRDSLTGNVFKVDSSLCRLNTSKPVFTTQ